MEQDTRQVPLFPLPNAVLFPNTLLPLHVFEPRYKEMVEVALAGDRRIAIAHLKPGWEGDYYGQPKVYKVMGIGSIVAHRPLQDGRHDIILAGECRSRMVDEAAGGEYRFRVGTLQPLADEAESGDALAEQDEIFQRLTYILQRMMVVLPDSFLSFPERVLQNPSPGTLADILVQVLVEEAYERQSLLEETRVLRRLKHAELRVKRALENGLRGVE